MNYERILFTSLCRRLFPISSLERRRERFCSSTLYLPHNSNKTILISRLCVCLCVSVPSVFFRFFRLTVFGVPAACIERRSFLFVLLLLIRGPQSGTAAPAPTKRRRNSPAFCGQLHWRALRLVGIGRCRSSVSDSQFSEFTHFSDH